MGTKFVYLTLTGEALDPCITFADLANEAQTVTYTYEDLFLDTSSGMDISMATGRLLPNGNVVVFLPYFSGIYYAEVNTAEVVRWAFIEKADASRLASYVDSAGNAYLLYEDAGEKYLSAFSFSSLTERSTSTVEVGPYAHAFSDTHLYSELDPAAIQRVPLSPPHTPETIASGMGYTTSADTFWLAKYQGYARDYGPDGSLTEYGWVENATGATTVTELRWEVYNFYGPYAFVTKVTETGVRAYTYVSFNAFPPSEIDSPVPPPTSYEGEGVFAAHLSNVTSAYVAGAFVFVGSWGDREYVFATADGGASWRKCGRLWWTVPIGFTAAAPTMRDPFFEKNFGATERPGYTNELPLPPTGG